MRDPRDTLHDSRALLDALSVRNDGWPIITKTPALCDQAERSLWATVARRVLADDLPDLIAALEREREDAAFAREQADRWERRNEELEREMRVLRHRVMALEGRTESIQTARVEVRR